MHVSKSEKRMVAPVQIPAVYTHYASILLFFYFGLMSLKDAIFQAKVCNSYDASVPARYSCILFLSCMVFFSPPGSSPPDARPACAL